MAKKGTPPAQSPSPIISLPQPPFKKMRDHLGAYGDHPWVYSAITNLAKEVAQMKLRLFKVKRLLREDKVEEVKHHPAKSLLHYVNDFWTFNHLIEITVTYLKLAGEAPWVLLRDSFGEPEQIWALRPDWVTVKPSKEKYIDYYIYKPGGGFAGVEEVRIDPEDIIFFKSFDPKNPYRGMGAIKPASMPLDIDIFSSEWNRNFYYNSALPFLILTRKRKLTKEQEKRILEAWNKEFRGTRNVAKIAFLTGGEWDVKDFSAKAKEIDFLDSKRYLRDEVLATFHTSKANLGVVEDVNRANQEATDRRYIKKVVKPMMSSLVAFLNEFYLKNWDDKGELFFDFDDPTPEDTELKLKVYENGLKNGWLTINEVRAEENRPPVDGGDQVYLPFSLQPIGAVKGFIRGLFGKRGEKEDGVLTLKVKGKINKSRKFNMPIPPKKLKEFKKEKIKKEIKHDLVKLIINLMSLNKKKRKPTPDATKEVLWRQMVAKTDVQEYKMRGLLKDLFKEQEETVLQNIKNAKKGLLGRKIKSGADDLLFDENLEIRKWLSVLRPFLKTIIEDKGRETLGFLGVDGLLDLATERAKRFLEKEGVKFIKEVNKVTAEKLRKTLAEGIEKKEGIPELSKRVNKVFREAIKSRAEIIARTEVLRATNFATNEGYLQSGVVTKKEWLTAMDERTCPWCNSMDGKIIDVKDTFFKKGDTLEVDGKTTRFDYEHINHPPLHPGCRCTLIPVIE